MGRLDAKNDDMATFNSGGGTLQFSAKKIEELGASEFTLVTVLVDVSYSLNGYENYLDKMLESIVEACRNPKNPRCDNMMLRVLLFSDNVEELHGFRPVRDINPADYAGACKLLNRTAAIDACHDAILAMNKYAEELVEDDCDVNGAIFLITDGMDNESTATLKMVSDALQAGRMAENLESVIAVLIGVGSGATEDSSQISSYLRNFHEEAGFTQYEFAGTASAESLARIGNFVSRSASSQSQALGTGGPSQSLSI